MSISSASITGTVTGITGNRIVGAVLTFSSVYEPHHQYIGITDDQGRYEIDLSTVGVEYVTPSAFSLDQNYPNPFNPTTTIPFTLRKSSFVRLIIYNISGQRVAELAGGEMAAGRHSVTWNGTDLNGSSVGAGIYFYQLNVEGYTETKKMLLLDGGSTLESNNITKSWILSAARTQETWQLMVRITHDCIYTYTKSGIFVHDGDAVDFTVMERHNLPSGIVFITIPEVTEPYVMNPDDGGTYSVTLSQYEMSTTEITNAQYLQFLNDARETGYITNTHSTVTGAVGDWAGEEYFDLDSGLCQIRHQVFDNSFELAPDYENRPIVMVTWYGAKAFAVYYGLDLPTEAEWQYAASGGMNLEYPTVDGAIDTTKANIFISHLKHTTDVMSYTPNPFGLFDMAGNVTEWCNDLIGAYPNGVRHNPKGYTASQTGSIIRGGSFVSSRLESYSVYHRGSYSQVHGASSIGFRVVRRPSE